MAFNCVTYVGLGEMRLDPYQFFSKEQWLESSLQQFSDSLRNVSELSSFVFGAFGDRIMNPLNTRMGSSLNNA